MRSRCYYEGLSRVLPTLVSAASSTYEAHRGPSGSRAGEIRAHVCSSVYALASEVAVKLDENSLAWVAGDRALTLAGVSGNSSAVAGASRAVAIAMRRSGLLPSAERRARLHVDTARAWHQHGRTDRATSALLAAEREVPGETRRPSVRALVSTLLYAPGREPAGLRGLAQRSGALV